MKQLAQVNELDEEEDEEQYSDEDEEDQEVQKLQQYTEENNKKEIKGPDFRIRKSSAMKRNQLPVQQPTFAKKKSQKESLKTLPPVAQKLPDVEGINKILMEQKKQFIEIQQIKNMQMAQMNQDEYLQEQLQRLMRQQRVNNQSETDEKDEQIDAHDGNPQDVAILKQEQKKVTQVKQFPSMLFDENPIIEINNRIRKKYLVFRVYEDPIQIRPYQPPDRGYYFDMRNCDIKIIRYTLEDNGFRELPNTKNQNQQPSAVMGSIQGIVSKDLLKQQASIIWFVCSIKNQVYQSLQKYQKINHFPCSFYITRKDLMYKQIAKLSEIHGQKHFMFIPRTYILPNEYQYLQQDMQRDTTKKWIFKPAAQAQGRGIFVTDKISEIPHKNSNSNYVVSEYIANPLLINGYKFDLRIYVVVTCINPLRIYMYEEGLARFATCKYDQNPSSGQKSKFMHLTNYSINKKNAAFMQNKDGITDGEGFKWSLTALRKLMRQLNIDDKAIFKSIEDIVIKTILSVEPNINQASEQYVPGNNNCFELLGFDILIDDLLQTWLIEVNLSPSLGCDSPLDQKIKGNLLADLFTLIGIVPLEQRKAVSSDHKYTKLNGMYSASLKAHGLIKSNNKTPQTMYGGNAYTLPQPGPKKTKQKKDRGRSMGPDQQSRKTLKSGVGNRKRENSQWTGSTNIGPSNTFSSSTQFANKPISREEQILVREVEDEFKRRGHFKRIFPTMEYHYYKQFFLQGERPLNKLIDDKIMEKRRLRTVALIQMQNMQNIQNGQKFIKKIQ